MADGGRYRLRRYSEFACSHDGVRLLPHRSYSQTRSTDFLNGGRQRLFSPLSETTSGSRLLVAALILVVDVLSRQGEDATWFTQVFQNRIVATPDAPGLPTPEGVHRDGVDHVLTLMIGRQGVVGGVSTIYDAASSEPLMSAELDAPGEALFNDDRTTRHGVSPLVTRDRDQPGFRDVLIALFHPDGRRPATEHGVTACSTVRSSS